MILWQTTRHLWKIKKTQYSSKVLKILWPQLLEWDDCPNQESTVLLQCCWKALQEVQQTYLLLSSLTSLLPSEEFDIYPQRCTTIMGTFADSIRVAPSDLSLSRTGATTKSPSLISNLSTSLTWWSRDLMWSGQKFLLKFSLSLFGRGSSLLLDGHGDFTLEQVHFPMVKLLLSLFKLLGYLLLLH